MRRLLVGKTTLSPEAGETGTGESAFPRGTGRALGTVAVAVALLVGLAGPVAAQQKPRVVIDQVLIGFPRGADTGEIVDAQSPVSAFKAGFWTPVYVYCTAGPEGIASGKVTVEATDTDDVQNAYTVPLPRGGVPANEPFLVITYTKPGLGGGEILVTVLADDRPYEFKRSFSAVSPGDVVYLGVGSRLTGMRQTIGAPGNETSSFNRTVPTYADRSDQLPDRWFGYHGVDLVILATGRREFATALLEEREGRKEALADWVRRGGRLVLSCGRNQDVVPELLRRMQMDLPFDMKEPLHLANLDAVQAWLPPGTPPLSNKPSKSNPGAAAAPIEVAKLERKPGREWELIVPARESDPSPPLVVRVPHGAGQVILVAFDLDQPPFTTWGGQGEFWKRLQDRTRSRPVEDASANVPNYRGFGAEGANDLATRLIADLENFPDVSVVSFGWVALFILVYIIIVGPLDYLFLKKVVGRLELTWITFPTIVLVVSAAAYFAAYSLKGNDLRINKVDVVDVDARTGQVYGTTWFTLFSPRIQNYTVGLEPALGEAPATAEGRPASVTLSWMGRPEVGYGGYNRAHAQSLFRRTYDYAPDAAGLQGVPVQVWSTKSFTANWEQPTSRSRPPIRAELRRALGAGGVEGAIVNQLPVALEDVHLVAGEGRTESTVRVYSLGRLEPGATKTIARGASAGALGPWLAGSAGDSGTDGLVRRLMFFEKAKHDDGAHDAALRYLDESWRLLNRGEAMLIARVKPTDGQQPAEQVADAPGGATRLWLGALPSSGAERPPLQGTMSQRTYVRAYLPVVNEAAP